MNNTANIKSLKVKSVLLCKIDGEGKYNQKNRSGEIIVIDDLEFSHDDGDDNDDEFVVDIN